MKIPRNRLIFLVLVVLGLTLACRFGAPPPTQAVVPVEPIPTREQPATLPATSRPTATQEAKATQTSVPSATTLPVASETSTPEDKPTQTEAPADTAQAPNVVAGQLNILQVYGYQDTYGYWRVLGLVRNDSNRAVNDIEVEVELFDANDNSLYVESALCALYNLAPGDITPFDLWIYEELQEVDRYTATIVGNGTASFERAEVDYRNVSLVMDEYDTIHLVGEIVNNSDQLIEISSLAAALFDSEGKIVTAGGDYVLVHTLDIGESGPFRFSLSAPPDITEDLTDYQFYAEAAPGSQEVEYPVSFSEHYQYLDAYGDYHLVGQVTNDSDQALNLSLVAGVYDADGKILDASTAYLPFYALAPGDTASYDVSGWGPIQFIPEIFEAVVDYQVMVDWYWSWNTELNTIDVDADEPSITFSEYDSMVSGKITNNTGAALESITVVVEFYDKSSRQLVATGYTMVYEEIPDGASITYEIYVYTPADLDPSSVDIQIIAKGGKPSG